jgi:flagellar biosynthesis/type III secretory pathway M-ring protein FliF/YscJ
MRKARGLEIGLHKSIEAADVVKVAHVVIVI